jgi:hypothetical protein
MRALTTPHLEDDGVCFFQCCCFVFPFTDYDESIKYGGHSLGPDLAIGKRPVGFSTSETALGRSSETLNSFEQIAAAVMNQICNNNVPTTTKPAIWKSV